MRRDINTVAGVFVILIVSIIFGYVLLEQSESLSDTVNYTPSGIAEIRSLQNALRDKDPTPLNATSSEQP